MKKVLVIIAMVLGVFLTGCGEKEVQNQKIYVVGTNPVYPPFEYLENGKMTGFDVELMEEIAKKVGIKMQWNNVTFDGLISALQSGKIDIAIAAMSVTDERKKSINFSVPYNESAITFLTNSENAIKDMNSLKNKKYGVQLGTTQETLANSIENATVVPYNSSAVAVMDLVSGKVDGVLVDQAVANNFVKSNPGIKIVGDITGDSLAMAFNKNFDASLLEKINTAILEMKKDGTLEKLAKKYKL